MNKAIVLFSGGLDSILSVKILHEQNIKLLGIFFKSCFFNSEQARIAAKSIKLPLKIVDFSKEQLKITKNPKYGYGKNMNPCIDCRILMFKQAKKIKEAKGFDFIATGEVLGQRPMSQNKQIMEVIEKEAKLKGYVLRPLSAKLLDPTIPEKKAWVDREKMLDIRGRSRKRQIEMAEKYKIKKYPSPSGGCLLTDPEFSKRLKKLIDIYPKCKINDIELLKIGRHFWQDKAKIIVGRNQDENKQIQKLAGKTDILIEMKNYAGPLTLIRDYSGLKSRGPRKAAIRKAKQLTQFYSLKSRGRKDIMFNIK